MRTLKILGGAVLMACILGLCCGCLSPADQARMDTLAAKILALGQGYSAQVATLKAEGDEVMAKVRAGTLTVAEGEEYTRLIREQVALAESNAKPLVAEAQAEWKELNAKKYGKWELVGGILLTILTTVCGIKVTPAKLVDPLLKGPWDK